MYQRMQPAAMAKQSRLQNDAGGIRRPGSMAARNGVVTRNHWVYLLACLGCCFQCCFPGTAHGTNVTFGLGESVPLAALLEGDTIVAGDQEFSNFDYRLIAGDLQPEDIRVVGIFDDILDGFGLRFGGEFVAGGIAEAPELQAELAFTVRTLEPDHVLSGVWLDGNPYAEGTGKAQIVENVVGVDVPPLSISMKTVDGVFINAKTSDGVFFPAALDIQGYPRLRVWKSISLELGDNALQDEAQLRLFQQVFTQLRIPEPTTLGLLVVMGLIGLPQRKNRYPCRA